MTRPPVLSAIGLLVLAALLLLGLPVLDQRLFHWAVASSALCWIVALVVLVVWELNTSRRASARVRGEQWPDGVLNRHDPDSPTGADALAYGLNRIKSADESDNPPTSPAASPPDFIQEAEKAYQQAAQYARETGTGCVHVGVDYGADGHTVRVSGVSSDELRIWPVSSSPEDMERWHAEQARQRLLDTSELEVKAQITGALISGAALVTKARQKNRDHYWGERARELLDVPNLPEEFARLLAGATMPTEAFKERAVQLVNEIHRYVPLALDGPNANSPENVRALNVLSDVRVACGNNAMALQRMVGQLADEVSKLQGVTVGQIGMALAGQRTAAMHEAEAEANTMPLIERMRGEGAPEVRRLLQELGWLVSLDSQMPEARPLFTLAWNGPHHAPARQDLTRD